MCTLSLLFHYLCRGIAIPVSRFVSPTNFETTMKKFILACACAFALGVSVSAQTPQKKEPAKTCCSPGAKSCDCKAGSACEKDGKKTCKNAQSKEAAKCDKQDGAKKSCCKDGAKCDKKDGAKCDKKDGAKGACCKDSAKKADQAEKK